MSQPGDAHFVWVVLALVQVAYCLWHILAKRALMSGTHPLIIAFYREVIACVCMYSLARYLDGQFVWTDFRRPDLKLFLLMGLLSFGNIIGFILALNFITAFNSALMHPTIPVFSAVLGAAVGVERLTRWKASGVGLCAVGAAVVVVWGEGAQADTSEAGGGGKHVFVGNLLLVGQCACMGGLLVATKARLDRGGVGPTTLTARYYSVAAALTVVVCMSVVGPPWDGRAEVRAAYNIWTQPEALVAAVYGGAVSVAFVYCALAWATGRSGPTAAALSMTLQPPFNAVLSVLFMHRTTFSPGEVGGGALVAAGLATTIWAQRRESRRGPGADGGLGGLGGRNSSSSSSGLAGSTGGVSDGMDNPLFRISRLGSGRAGDGDEDDGSGEHLVGSPSTYGESPIALLSGGLSRKKNRVPSPSPSPPRFERQTSEPIHDGTTV